VTEHCGIGLTPYGYYPCAVAGGIDRIVGVDRGRKSLPDDDDDLQDQLAVFCRMCGHYDPVPTATVGDRRSPSWAAAYAARRPGPRVFVGGPHPRRY
jgi:hypothetical protein